MAKKDELKSELEDLQKQIQVFLEKCDGVDGLRSSNAEQIAYEAAVYGASNSYEGIGILGHALSLYIKTVDEVFNLYGDIPDSSN